MNAQKNMKHVDIELQKIKGRDIVSAKIHGKRVSIFKWKIIKKALEKAGLTKIRLPAHEIKVHNGSFWKPLIGQLKPTDRGHYTFWSSWTNKNDDLNRVALFRDSAKQTYCLVWFDFDRPLKMKQWVEYPETPRKSKETADVKTIVKISNNPFSLLTLETATKIVPKVVNEFPQIGTPKPVFNRNWKEKALKMKKPSVVKTTIPKSPVIDRKENKNNDEEINDEYVEDGWSDRFDDDYQYDEYQYDDDYDWFDNYEGEDEDY